MDNYLEMDFGDSAADLLIGSLNPGDCVRATSLLTQLEGESEETVFYVLDALDKKQVTVVPDDLPVACADGATAVRLRREQQLVTDGNLMTALEETDPLRLYLEELAQIPVCGDLPALAQPLRQANESGNLDAPVYNQVFNLCISCVVELAKTYAGKGVLLSDLIQDASLGLWGDLTTYAGGDLEAFRDRSIHKHLQRAVICQAHASGVGQKLRQALEDYRQVDEQLLTELGRNPTVDEIAEAMHMGVQQVALVADMVENARNLHRAKNPENTQDLPEEEDQAVEDTAYFQMRQRIAELLSGLSERDAKLLTLRYGLEGGAPLTPEQAGAKLGMTPEEVIAAETDALSKLRTQ